MAPGPRSSIVHVRSVTVHAPVATVFEHVRDPRSFVAADPEPVQLSAVSLTPAGVGSSWRTSWHVLGLPVHASWTRTVLVPDERIVDHASTGVTWEYTTTRAPEGTRLSLGYAPDTGWPVVDGILDRAFGNQEPRLDTMLRALKAAIEGTEPAKMPERSPGVASRLDRRLTVPATASRARAAISEGMKRAAWDWAGVPRGPLGWLSTRTVFPLTSGTSYRAVADTLQLGPDDELLDVACGSGAFLAQHAGHVRRVAGIDLSDVQVPLAHRALRERIAAGSATVVHGDASSLPWPDESFTAVTCVSSFEVFPDPEKVLAEMFRVLRPGGRVAVNIGERVPPGTETHRMWDAVWVWSEDDVRRMVDGTGFTEVDITYAASFGTDPVSTFLVWLWRRLGNDMSELRLVRAVKEQRSHRVPRAGVSRPS
jgi:SAM-dependent methyltransferase